MKLRGKQGGYVQCQGEFSCKIDCKAPHTAISDVENIMYYFAHVNK